MRWNLRPPEFYDFQAALLGNVAFSRIFTRFRMLKTVQQKN